MPYFDDDGTELNPDLIVKPGLCQICKKDNDPSQTVLCTLTRLDQSDEEEFECYDFEYIGK